MDELSLEFIKDLGGTKDDLRLLADLSDEDDVTLPGEAFEADPVKREEVKKLIKELGLAEYRPDHKKETKKPKKLLEAPLTEKSAEGEPSASQKEVKVSTTTTTRGGEEELRSHLKTPPQHSYMLCKPGESWLDDQTGVAAEEGLVKQCEEYAARLLQDEVALYKKQREKTKRGESTWIRTVLTSGTLSDKMAALMVLVQESSLHNLTALDTLVAMARKKGKREAMLSSDTLKNLFLSETSPLPEDRKLISFDARPFSTLWETCSGNRAAIDKRLLCWHAEDQLRQKYASFVKALDVMSYDTLPACKEKALAIMQSLISGKPEQENVLLPMMVNKLGDPNNKIASKASYLLIKLVEEHPNMKSVIVGEVEKLVYRPNITERAQYYAMCFLNQVKLHKADHALASRLISIYFNFFKVYVKKGEADSKMMAALLTGVNRAFPYAKVEQDFLAEQMGTLYKIVHIVNFNTSIQALMLLLHVVDPSNSESDRFFMALYRKLLDPGLRSSAKQPQFLNLLYRSMKADVVDKRVVAFLKRLLQAGSLLGPHFLCGALIVISEVLKDRPHLLRIRQMGKSTSGADDDDDEEERFVDLPLPPEFQDSDNVISHEETKADDDDNKNSDAPKQEGSWLHRQNLTDQKGYNCYQRNPLYSHAHNECLWELQALTRHFHPSVSLFAHTLLKGESIEYPSDPLQDFTLIRFLDRFVYKNPKKKETVEERRQTVGRASGKRQQAPDSVPVNSAKFLQGGEEAVPEHERYLYRYFSQRAEEKRKKEEEEGSDVDSVSDSEFDTFLDKHEKQMDQDDLGDMDLGLDFARSMGGNKKNNQRKSAKADSSDEDVAADEDEDGDNDDGDLSDEEIDFGEDDELAAEFRAEMEALGGMDDGEEEDDDDEELSGDELKQMMSGRKRGPEDELGGGKPNKKSRKDNLASMFAAADDFADVLESNADTGLASSGTGDAVFVSDKASAKQIAWEMKRDRQSRGSNRKDKKRHGGKFAKGGHKHKRRR